MGGVEETLVGCFFDDLEGMIYRRAEFLVDFAVRQNDAPYFGENKVQAINFQNISKFVIPNLFRDLSEELGKELLFLEQESPKPFAASLSGRC